MDATSMREVLRHSLRAAIRPLDKKTARLETQVSDIKGSLENIEKLLQDRTSTIEHSATEDAKARESDRHRTPTVADVNSI